MDDVNAALPTLDRFTFAVDIQPYMPKDLFHELPCQPDFTSDRYITAHGYPNVDFQLLSNWDGERGLVYSPHRKRILTKDTTGALKLWLRRHKKNPYPSKAEKIMLAILSKMTLTQVSTWFANARRRLKKDYPDEDNSERFQDDSGICTNISTYASYNGDA